MAPHIELADFARFINFNIIIKVTCLLCFLCICAWYCDYTLQESSCRPSLP